jgi:hypothetical protein
MKLPVTVQGLLDKAAAAGLAQFAKSKFTLSTGMILAVLGVYLVGHHKGYADAKASFTKAVDVARAEMVAHDLEIQHDIAATAGKQRDDLQTRFDALQKTARKYEDGLKAQSACLLTDRDVRRLRGIQ